MYFLAKSLHFVGLVSWMAGLFYLVRIMVYHAEALQRPEPERGILAGQFLAMQWKVYRIIIVPAVLITWSFGTMMLSIMPAWLQQPWMWVKLLLLAGLSVYTHACKGLIRQFENGTMQRSHAYFRAMNEVPTLFLVAIVFLAVFKSGINWYYLGIGMAVFAGLIFSAVRKVARSQATHTKKPSENP